MKVKKQHRKKLCCVPWCGYIRRYGRWRKCTYNHGYCKYWKECVRNWDIRRFESRKLQTLYELDIKGKEEELKKKLEEQKAQEEARKDKKLSEYA